MSTLVLYHKSCFLDGFMSAFIAYLALGRDGVEYVAADYGDPIPDFTGKTVYILDLSYDPEQLIKASATAEQVILLDHHKSAMLNWIKVADPNPTKEMPMGIVDVRYPNLQVMFDLNHSGAGMTWMHFQMRIRKKELSKFSPEPYPQRQKLVKEYLDKISSVAKAVQDYDLWSYVLPSTKEICASLGMVEKSLEEYECFFQNTSISAMVAQGGTILKANSKLAKSIADSATIMNFLEWKVPYVYCNCPKDIVNEVGQILSQGHPFAVICEIVGKTNKFSLRSNDGAEDVSLIAARFGGGGHRNAAGFYLSGREFSKLFDL